MRFTEIEREALSLVAALTERLDLIEQGDDLTDSIAERSCASCEKALAYREKLVGPGGTLDGSIVAIDLLPMAPIAGVEFLEGDFREDTVLAQLDAMMGPAPSLDLVLSDLAPNLLILRRLMLLKCAASTKKMRRP